MARGNQGTNSTERVTSKTEKIETSCDKLYISQHTLLVVHKICNDLEKYMVLDIVCMVVICNIKIYNEI